MRVFRPARVFVEPEALEYPLGRQLRALFLERNIPVSFTTSHNRVTGIPGKNRRESFYEAKRTLVIAVRRSKTFQTSKPSADYALPLVTGCPGHCHYCYLNTTLGPKPYIRVYVNLEEILDRAVAYMERKGDVTVFDGSCTSDPVIVEPWTGALRRVIEFFAHQPLGRFRFVTKYDAVDGLLDAQHGGHTEIRFSVNSAYVVSRFEKAVAGLERRLEAAAKVARAGYPFGFLIGPIMVYKGWEREYAQLLQQIRGHLEGVPLPEGQPTFELITHRFTPRAKNIIQEVYPETTLPMDETERRWKWGQFGYGKWVYPQEIYERVQALFQKYIGEFLPGAQILYTV